MLPVTKYAWNSFEEICVFACVRARVFGCMSCIVPRRNRNHNGKPLMWKTPTSPSCIVSTVPSYRHQPINIYSVLSITLSILLLKINHSWIIHSAREAKLEIQSYLLPFPPAIRNNITSHVVHFKTFTWEPLAQMEKKCVGWNDLPFSLIQWFCRCSLGIGK